MEVRSSASSRRFARRTSGLQLAALAPSFLSPSPAAGLPVPAPPPAVQDPRPRSGPARREHPGHRLRCGRLVAQPLARKRVAAAPLCPAGEQNSKQGDENTLNGVFETVMRVHYPAALGRIAVRTVPCPAVCVDAFSLVSK